MKAWMLSLAGMVAFGASHAPAVACWAPRNFLHAVKPELNPTSDGERPIVVKLRVEQALVSTADGGSSEPIAFRARLLEAMGEHITGDLIAIVSPTLGNYGLFWGKPNAEDQISGYVELAQGEVAPGFYTLAGGQPTLPRLRYYVRHPEAYAWRPIRFTDMEEDEDQ